MVWGMGADVNAASRKDAATGATRVGREPTEFFFQEIKACLYTMYAIFRDVASPRKLYQVAAFAFCTFWPLAAQK